MKGSVRDRADGWYRGLGSRKVRAALLLIIVIGAGARVAWVAHAGVHPRFDGDEEAYLLQGETIARGEGYANALVDIENVIRKDHRQTPLARQPASFYPPGYPVFIAAVTWTVWHTPIPDADLVRVIEYLQAMLGALTILFVFLLARRVFDPLVGLVAAAIVAAYPNLIATTATLQFETVFITLLLGATLVLVPSATREDTRWVRLVAGGVVIGVAALIHPTVALLIIAFLVVRVAMRRPWKETVRDVAILVATVAVVVGPWTIRNVVQLHAFVPLATGAGPALCMSRNREATGGIDLGILDRECSPKHSSASFTQHDVDVNRYATSQAIHWAEHHPFDELKMWWTRTRLAYRHDTSGFNAYATTMSAGPRRAADDLFDDVSFVVVGLAIVGAALTVVRRRRPAAIFLLVTTLGLAAIPIVLFGDPRYRVPAEPFFAVLAAAAIGAAFDLAHRSPNSVA